MSEAVALIPELKKAAVGRALRQALGLDECEEIRILTGGLSTALVFRIVVRGRPYVLRVIMRTDAMGDPTRLFARMQAAADAGIAPGILYTSIDDRISITEFIESKPWPHNSASMIATTIRRVHSLPAFPKSLNPLGVIDAYGFIRQFQAANILPQEVTEELFRLHAELARAYPRGTDDVSCHNDLKPENMVFDGARVWLVDWEAAFLNDRYTDLAVPANFFVRDESHEEAYLRAYFGEPPGEYRRARFFLMQQAVRVSYVTAFMLIAAAGEPIDPDMTAPDFGEFHRQMLSGQVSMATREAKLQYAKVHFNEALRCMRSPRFKDAIALVGERHARE